MSIYATFCSVDSIMIVVCHHYVKKTVCHAMIFPLSFEVFHLAALRDISFCDCSFFLMVFHSVCKSSLLGFTLINHCFLNAINYSINESFFYFFILVFSSF